MRGNVKWDLLKFLFTGTAAAIAHRLLAWFDHWPQNIWIDAAIVTIAGFAFVIYTITKRYFVRKRAAQLVYKNLTSKVTTALGMDNWEWTCDHLFRGVMPEDYPERVGRLSLEHFRTRFPHQDMRFEAAMQNLVTRAKQYLDHYMSNAEMHPYGNCWVGVKKYKDNPDHEMIVALIDEYNAWQRGCTMLLFNMVRAMNEFADAVRTRLDANLVPSTMFCVYDLQGLMSDDLEETWHIPPRYFSDNELAERPDGDAAEIGDIKFDY